MNKFVLQDKHIWIGLGILLVVVVSLLGFLLSRRGSTDTQNNHPPQQIFVTPQNTPTSLVTPIPLVTPENVPGNIWIVSRTNVSVVHQNGYSYIVDEFRNEKNPSLVMLARCGAPSWPAPEVGHKYVMNEWNVLGPIEGIDSKLQRFYPIK